MTPSRPIHRRGPLLRRGAARHPLSAAAGLLGLFAAVALTGVPPRIAGAQDRGSAATVGATPAGADTAAPLVDLDERIDRLRTNAAWFGVPDVPATEGGRTVAVGTSVAGPLAVRNGTLEVYGTVQGDAIAYGGDVVVHPGARVTGDAIAALGQVRVEEGGIVEGGIRSIRGAVGIAAPVPASSAERSWHALLLLVGWAAVVIPIGIGVLVFAGQYLDRVAETLELSFGKAFGAGVLGQLVMVPGLAVVVVLLAITVLGVLLIPFAIVGYAAAGAGLVMLGTLAAARVVGSAAVRASGAAATAGIERRRMLKSLMIGLAGLFVPWLIAALLVSVPVAGGVARAIAVGLTWVGISAGFGAALLSRGGTRRPASTPAPLPPPEDDISWQTPTPVGGVVAARRPTAATSSRGTI